MVEIRFAKNRTDLEKIRFLQRKNTLKALTSKAAQEQGFVTVLHSLEQLEEMQQREPQIIALEKETLAGYALVMSPELKTTVPLLVPLFKTLDTLSYRGKSLKSCHYYVMGQICIAKNYRGHGLFRRLYQAHRETLSSKYDFCITEISARNTRSMAAHQKIGFEQIHQFTDETDLWNVVLWDWSK